MSTHDTPVTLIAYSSSIMSPTKKNTPKKSSAPAPKKKKDGLFQTLRGVHDILPKDEVWWMTFMKQGMETAELHGFHFIETPIIEPAALFEAGVGATTDIVEKEMYTWKTKGGDHIALRPEHTASLIRSYVQHHLGHFASPLKVFHYGPIFRYERPQAGRYRQFHMWDFDIIGDFDPWYDVQIILTAIAFFETLHISGLCLKINTIGCRVCRPSYRKKLIAYYKGKQKKLCSDCVRRLTENPLRLLDCKNEDCRKLRENAPVTLNYLCQSCNAHFKGVLELIEESDLDYEPDPYLVRGLDYYNKTVFEIVLPTDHSFALAGGGRYDYLGEIIGTRTIPAVGVGIGMERIIEYMKEDEKRPEIKEQPTAFFVAIGCEAKKLGVCVTHRLRTAGIRTIEAIGKKSMGAQMKAADKANARLALIIGQRECFEGTVIIRDMKTGVQETVVAENIVQETKKRLK